MNALLCAQLLMLVSDSTKWTECVLGHQAEGQTCICRIDYLRVSKCFSTTVCKVITSSLPTIIASQPLGRQGNPYFFHDATGITSAAAVAAAAATAATVVTNSI